MGALINILLQRFEPTVGGNTKMTLAYIKHLNI